MSILGKRCDSIELYMDFRNKNIGRLSTTVYFWKEENVKHRNYVTYRINLNLICRYHLKLFCLLLLFSFRVFFNLYLYSSIFIFKLVSKSVNKVGYIWPHCRTPMWNRNKSGFFCDQKQRPIWYEIHYSGPCIFSLMLHDICMQYSAIYIYSK